MTPTYLLGDETSSDTISTEDSRGLLLFELGTTDSVEYALEVDWDGDGVFSGDNEAD